MKTFLISACLLSMLSFSSPARADVPPLACAHPLPKSFQLCMQAYKLGTQRNDSRVTKKIAHCGYVFPNKVRECLRDLVESYGGDPIH